MMGKRVNFAAPTVVHPDPGANAIQDKNDNLSNLATRTLEQHTEPIQYSKSQRKNHRRFLKRQSQRQLGETGKQEESKSVQRPNHSLVTVYETNVDKFYGRIDLRYQSCSVCGKGPFVCLEMRASTTCLACLFSTNHPLNCAPLDVKKLRLERHPRYATYDCYYVNYNFFNACSECNAILSKQILDYEDEFD